MAFLLYTNLVNKSSYGRKGDLLKIVKDHR